VHEIAGVGTIFPDESGAPVLHMHAAMGRDGVTRAGCIRPGIEVWQLGEVVILEPRADVLFIIAGLDVSYGSTGGVVEAGAPLSAEDLDIFHLVEPASTIMVRNKVDLTDNAQIPPVPETADSIPAVSISAKFGQGIERLVDVIFNTAIPEDAILAEGDGLPNLRQKIGLEKAVDRIGSAMNLVHTEQPDELTALEISEGIAYLDGVLGNEVPEDVLDLVFANFCIGK
jgi:hypothetical protein